MSETIGITNAAPVSSVAVEKKGVKKISKKSSTSSSHPPTQQMVDASIKNLKERGGSSLLAIKKYISATYKCDAQKLSPFIKKYLKSAVANGKLIQTKGKGASGSFKLSVAVKKVPKEKLKPTNEKKLVKISKVKKTSAKASVAAKEKVKKSVVNKKVVEQKNKKTKVKAIKKTDLAKVKPTKTKAKVATSVKAKVKKVAKMSAKKVAAPKKVVK